jgi:RNA polymerase sigma-70 factor (ECF subfamily)
MDRADFHALYERHARDVFRFAFYLCGERARAEDVAAETFARAWTATGEVRTATVKAYLFAIVRNLVRESARRDGRERGIDEGIAEGIIDPGPNPSASVDGRIELRAVLAALQKLPETDRAAILMRAQDGMSHEEIAAALGLSVAAVRVRIHRARLELNALKIREERRP